jgi:triacylglycerol lipase
VLVHGLFGFDAMRVIDLELVPYFRGVRSYLSRPGNRVFTAKLSPTGRVKRRAIQLRRYLDRVAPNEPVHLFAHSMGGLDARYMINRLGGEGRVLTLTTLGTPHRGTAFADWGLERWGLLFQPPNLPFVRPVPALLDLSTEACKRFNETILDSPKVRYFSVAARFPGRWWQPPWMFSANLIQKAEGDNDGLVSVESARYGETFDVWEGHHLSLVNWPTMQRIVSFQWQDQRWHFGQLVQRLHDLGF